MTDQTAALAALIAAMENDYPFELAQMKPADIAARLIAAGVTLAPTPPDAPDVRGALARAWKRRAKMYKGLWMKQLREFHDWRTALRAAGISEMVDMNPDAIRLTITVPREKRINEMVEERIAAIPPTPPDALREALLLMLDEPTMDFHTSASRTLFEKAMRSSTQEVTITAQALRMMLPAIEAEAVNRALRAALAREDQP